MQEIHVTETTREDGLKRFEQVDPVRGLTTYPEIRQKIEDRDYTDAEDRVEGLVATINRLRPFAGFSGSGSGSGSFTG